MRDLQKDLTVAQAQSRGVAVDIESGNLEPSLFEHYGRAAALVTAAIELLHDGMPGESPERQARPEFLKRKLTDAVECYGLDVIDADPNSLDQRDIRSSGHYRGRPLDAAECED